MGIGKGFFSVKHFIKRPVLGSELRSAGRICPSMTPRSTRNICLRTLADTGRLLHSGDFSSNIYLVTFGEVILIQKFLGVACNFKNVSSLCVEINIDDLLQIFVIEFESSSSVNHLVATLSEKTQNLKGGQHGVY
jgi:hypothetical protein